MHDQRHAGAPDQAPRVGDHLAMDLLNTEVRSHGAVVDCWQGDEDLCRWLLHGGVITPADIPAPIPEDLLAQARALRALARELITLRKADAPVDPTSLNHYLHAHLSAPHLARDEAGRLVLHRLASGGSAAAVLGPVAEAVAQLLVEADFALVRQCEHPDCILWFYDRTKSHKRRWCSMAQCGNRHKAMQFRSRKHGSA